MPALAPELNPSELDPPELDSPTPVELPAVGIGDAGTVTVVAAGALVADLATVVDGFPSSPRVVWLRSVLDNENPALLMPTSCESFSLSRRLNQHLFAVVS